MALKRKKPNTTEGEAYYKEGEYENALKEYNNAIRLSPLQKEYHNKRGLIYCQLKDYNEAIIDFENALKIDKEYVEAQNNKGLCLIMSEEYKEAAKYFIDIKLDYIDVLILYPLEETKKVISYMISEEENNFFKKTLTKYNIQKQEDYKLYKKIYLQSLDIMHLLHVNHEYEQKNGIAHYTHKAVAEKLIFENSPLRLSSVVNANDPKEGKPLLDFLEIDESCIDGKYQAFIACFTFNHECLNQFRLYGKEKEEEGTGISIIFDKSLINPSKDPEAIISLSLKENNDNRRNFYNLFRCIYMNPKTKQIYSLGQKEIEEENREGKNYKEYIEQKKEKINEKLKELKKMIEELTLYNTDRYKLGITKGEVDSFTEIEMLREKILDFMKVFSFKYQEEKNEIEKSTELSELKDHLISIIRKETHKYKEYYSEEYLESLAEEELNNLEIKNIMKKIICELLLNLRYLVKHSSFKEEQECRIFTIKNLSEQKDDIKIEGNRMYINMKEDIKHYIQKIYFGPKASGLDFFKDRLQHKQLDKIDCVRSELHLS